MSSAEAIVYGATQALVAGRCYPDVGPDNVVKPYITYQAVGGQDETTFDGLNQLQNTRMQVNVWTTSRSTAVALMQQVLQALTVAPIYGTPIGAPVSEYEDDTKLYGSRLDISIWFSL